MNTIAHMLLHVSQCLRAYYTIHGCISSDVFYFTFELIRVITSMKHNQQPSKNVEQMMGVEAGVIMWPHDHLCTCVSFTTVLYYFIFHAKTSFHKYHTENKHLFTLVLIFPFLASFIGSLSSTFLKCDDIIKMLMHDACGVYINNYIDIQVCG